MDNGEEKRTDRVFLTIPCGDGRIETLTMISVLQACAAASVAGGPGKPSATFDNQGIVWGDTLRGPFILGNNSNIADARNGIAHYFKTQALDCDRLVLIDSDIAFTLEDFAFLLEGDEDIVIAPYSKKFLGEAPVEWGCGFARIHRRVFEALDAWLNEETQEDALQRYSYAGRPGLCVDYFFTGAMGGRWFGEDAGFWNWCAIKGFSMRKEKRTKLTHIGKFYFCYPNQVPGMILESAGAQ